MMRSVASAAGPIGSHMKDYEAFLSGLREAVESAPAMPVNEVRGMFAHWGDHTSEPDAVAYAEVQIAGVPAIWARPTGCPRDRVLICSHGGGYSCGSTHTHRKLYGHVAKAVGCNAVVVGYRRAPEHRHPAPLEDVFAVYRGLLETGSAPECISFVGDSAGGALSITTLLKARAEGLPMPAATIPLAPWVDLEATSSTYEENRHRDVVNSRELVQAMGRVFVGEGGDLRDPLAAPLYADLSGFPPIYIQVGGYETFLGDAMLLAERARRSGVKVELDVVAGMQHCFQMLAGNAPQADDAIARLAVWVRPKLGLA